MKRVLDYLIPLLVLVACGREEVPDPNGGLRLPVGEVYHGMIELGDKLEDPYTVENMREALTKAYPTKADRIDIRTTDLYVRFLPADDGQLRMLQNPSFESKYEFVNTCDWLPDVKKFSCKYEYESRTEFLSKNEKELREFYKDSYSEADLKYLFGK